MERHDLEDRIRASLQARADDVQATPHLWEQVSARTARRARWHLGLWALSGAAALVAVVFGGMLLLDNPRSVQIEPEPVAPSTTPEVDETPATEEPAPAATAPTVVTTDGQHLFVVDATTGEVTRELDPLADLREVGGIAEVAVRPVRDEGVLTVATVLQAEGTWNLEVSVFDAEGARVDRLRLPMAGAPVTELAPEVVWSEDGRYLLWAGASAHDGPPAGPALWAYDWVERPVDGDGVAQPFTATAPGADGALFQDGGTVDLREWSGPLDGGSTLVATTTTGRAFRVGLDMRVSECAGNEPCPPEFVPDVMDLGFEGMSPIDLGTLGNGVNLALVVPTAGRGGPEGDAESATLELRAAPMDDQQRTLDVPRLTDGTGSPLDAWMAVAGDRIAIGMGPEVHLLTVAGDTVEELEVTDTVTLPAGTVATGMATLTRGPQTPIAPTPATPTEEPSEDQPAAVLDDGLPAHVVSYFPSAQEFLLEDRARADDPIITWARPTGIPAELQLDEVEVWPRSTTDRLEVVTSWGQGADTRLARTVVQDGSVVSNDAFPDAYQPNSLGGSTASPVFDPNGNYLAWVESVDQPVLRAVRWQNGSPSADLGRSSLDGAPPLGELDDWAMTEQGSLLTARVEDRAAPQMVEIRLLGTEDQILLDGAPQVVDLPGPLVEAGSFPFDGGDTRYVVFDDGGLRYALADGIASAIELGDHQAPDEVRLVLFGPDSLTYQRAEDGTFLRAQVDTGATSTVDAPGATMAFLPWPEP